MHVPIIVSVFTWIGSVTCVAALTTKVALAIKAASAAKTIVATKTYLAAKTVIASKTAVEVTGAGVTTGLGLANGLPCGPFPIQPMTPQQWKLIIESIKNTPHEIYDLYQSIPPEVFKWLWDIGSIGYGASGVYEGYKVATDISENLNDPVPVPVPVQ